MTIKKSSLVFFLMTIMMFMPSYFSNTVFDWVENIVFCLSLLLLLIYMYKPSKVSLLIACYWIYLVVMTIIHKNSTIDSHLIVSNAKVIVFVFLIDFMMRNNLKSTINILFYVLLVYVLADFISLLIFPDGLYFTETVWNEWTTSYSAQWILGNKNNRSFWYFMLQIVAYGRYLLNNKKSKWLPTFISVISLIAVILCESSTGTVAMIFAGIGFAVAYYKSSEMKIRPSLMIIYICYLILLLLILLGNTAFLAPIVQNLFGKDVTFSNRTSAWDSALLQILQHPIFGSGIISNDNATIMLGSLSYTDAHNSILNILWQGGVVALVIMVLIFIEIHRKSATLKSNNNIFIVTMLIAAVLVETIFEASLSYGSASYFLIILYDILTLMAKDSERQTYQIKRKVYVKI